MTYLYTLAFRIADFPAIYLQSHYQLSPGVNYAVIVGMN